MLFALMDASESVRRDPIIGISYQFPITLNVLCSCRFFLSFLILILLRLIFLVSERSAPLKYLAK